MLSRYSPSTSPLRGDVKGVPCLAASVSPPQAKNLKMDAARNSESIGEVSAPNSSYSRTYGFSKLGSPSFCWGLSVLDFLDAYSKNHRKIATGLQPVLGQPSSQSPETRCRQRVAGNALLATPKTAFSALFKGRVVRFPNPFRAFSKAGFCICRRAVQGFFFGICDQMFQNRCIPKFGNGRFLMRFLHFEMPESTFLATRKYRFLATRKTSIFCPGVLFYVAMDDVRTLPSPLVTLHLVAFQRVVHCLTGLSQSWLHSSCIFFVKFGNGRPNV